MYRALNIPPQLWVSDGTSNREGDLTNSVEEEPLIEGIWEVSGTERYQMQVNTESGQGMGVAPQTWFGQSDIDSIQIDAQWSIISVPIGEIRYLVIKKFFGQPDGTYYLNKNSGP